MCTTELWIYRDCGCRFPHFIPCPQHNFPQSPPDTMSEDDNESPDKDQHYTSLLQNPSPFHSTSRIPAPISDLHGSPSKRILSMEYGTWLTPKGPKPLSNEGTNSSGPRREGCQFQKFVDKQFLEPICDDCVVAEARGTRSVGAREYHTPPLSYDQASAILIETDDEDDIGTCDDGRLILESHVEIAVMSDDEDTHQDHDMQIQLEDKKEEEDEQRARTIFEPIHERNIDLQIMQAMEDELPSLVTTYDHRISTVQQGVSRLDINEPNTTTFHPEPLTINTRLDNSVSFPHQNYRPESALTTGNDADDEDSLRVGSSSPPSVNEHGNSIKARSYSILPFRTRGLRTASKEWRRRAMDISREEVRLRISSRMSSGERKHWEHWRRKVKRIHDQDDDGIAAGKLAFRQDDNSPERRGRTTVKKWATEVAARVRQSIGRSSSRPRKRMVDDRNKSPVTKALPRVSSTGTVVHGRGDNSDSSDNDNSFASHRQGQSSINTIFECESDEQSDGGQALCEEEIKTESPSPTRVTWEEHLRDDLQTNRLRPHSGGSSHEVPGSCDGGSESYVDQQRISGVQRRLLSVSSASPSIPTTSSAITSSSWPTGTRTIGMEVASGEFEEFQGLPSGNWLSVTKVPEKDGVDIEEEASPLSADSEITFGDSIKAPMKLSLHPLATPLRMSTPSGSGPSRSLFSPPASKCMSTRS